MVKCTKRQIGQLKTALHWKMPEAQRQRIQMILLRESGMTQPAIAEAMGVSLSTVNRAHMAYDGRSSNRDFAAQNDWTADGSNGSGAADWGPSSGGRSTPGQRTSPAARVASDSGDNRP
jgi:hypothetical protein